MVKEEKKMKSTSDENGISEEINEGPSLATAAVSMETSSKDDSSLSEKEQEDQLKSTKAEMGEVREENERLKMVLGQIVKDYKSLQKHFLNIVKQEEESKKSIDIDSTHQEDEENELVSLSLGTHAREPKKHDKRTIFNLIKQDEKFNEGPKLGLDCKFEPSLIESAMNPSPENSVEEQKEEEPSTTETWLPGKTLKTMRSGEDELLQQNQLKRTRVSVRARCDTPTMNDGCQWRKYGQKIAKGNPCPRAYYRCTVSQSCPVRKQVQRCAEDMSILITTYEGTHNHPLPMSATAMASTTSAAASMLQSGSSSSQPGHGASITTNATSNTANLHGLNFTSSHNSSKVPQQFYFPNSSISTLNSHPTITLDLTAPTTSHNFNRFSSAPRYPSTCLNFSSSTSTSSCLESNSSGIQQTSWGSGYLSYGTPSTYNNRSNQVGYSLTLGRQPPQEQLYQAHFMQTNNNQNRSQSTLIENTVAAATKAAITSDPTFRSAFEAAITSLVNNNGGGGGLGGDEIKSSHNMKWGYY